MKNDSDIENLAIASRHKLTQEFAEKYANLQERMRRVPVEHAQKIADQYSCPLQVAMMAYIIDMNGILSVRVAVGLITDELYRRASVGDAVPNLPGNIQEFVITEGRWIEHTYGTFVRELELKVRELSNLESSFDDEIPPVETAISLFEARNKLARTFISPLVVEWLNDHPKANSEDVLNAFGLAITKWKKSTLRGKFKRLRTKNQALFRRIRESLRTAEDSATIESSIARLDQLVDDLGVPLDKMNSFATSHFLLYIAPRPTGRGDMSRSVIVSPSTRGFKAEPDMTSPFDYLERDVRLARRRDEDEQESFLKARIERVIRVLKYQGFDLFECVQKCVTELIDRLNVPETPLEEVLLSYEAELTSTSPLTRDEIAIGLVTKFVFKFIYGV